MRKLLAGVLIVLCVATVTDFSVAAYAEYRYSRALRAASDLDFDPEVTITGFPFIAQAAGDDYEQIGITARGLTWEMGDEATSDRGCPVCIESGGDWVITESTELRVDEVTGSLKIDSVNLGRFLAIEDLTVTTPAPEDKAGGGGPGDGILSSDSGLVLTGTVNLPEPGNSGHTGPPLREKVSVSADLSVRGGALRIDATSLYSGSADHVDSDIPDAAVPFLLAQFSQTLPVLSLPWSLRAVSAASQGSDVVLEGEPKPLVVTARDFLPGS